MKSTASHNGFAVALAWPQTLCKQPGSWYDNLMGMMGFCRQHYYKAGHAAVLLVDDTTGQCDYYDFGRYHAPFGHGRVRSAATDHDLTIKTRAILSDGKQRILNFHEILEELSQNPSCHGDGTLYGAHCRVNFIKASDKARKMQESSTLPYGPFIWNGTNCSRFVRTVILAGKPSLKNYFRLGFLNPVSPTPRGNINNLGHSICVSPQNNTKESHTSGTTAKYVFRNKNELQCCLPAPETIPPGLPRPIQWLSGEGAGSWFHIKALDDERVAVARYAPGGEPECQSTLLNTTPEIFQPAKPFRLMHLSHCKQLHIRQGNIQFIFTA